VQRNRDVLANRPVWLFSSGPLGSDVSLSDPKLEPKEIAEFREAINPREHRVFLRAFDCNKVEFKYRMVAKMPAARALFPQGDFRNWKDIETWANGIAHKLAASQPRSEAVMVV